MWHQFFFLDLQKWFKCAHWRTINFVQGSGEAQAVKALDDGYDNGDDDGDEADDDDDDDESDDIIPTAGQPASGRPQSQ